MYKLTLAFFSLFFLIGSPAIAAGTANEIWIVTQLSGDARVVHPGAQSASLKVSDQLAPGDILTTGASGRATLVHGGDYILVAPRSQLKLPSTPQPTGFTRVVQTLGTLLFKVQHTGIPHFAVDTPMLAAVVKGTTFTVVVDQQRSAVQVIKGIVQVSALEGGMTRMVEGGRTVFIEHAMPKLLKDADKPLPATSPPSSTSVRVSATSETPLATIASLTGGLVRAEVAVVQPAQANAPANPTAGLVQSTSTVQPTVAGSMSTAAPTGNAGASVTSAPSTGVVVGATGVVATAASTPAPSTPPPTPPASTSIVVGPTVSTPIVTIASNSGPGGSSNSGPGSVNSGPGSISSGSGGSNSGPGSINSGPGSVSSGSGGSNSSPGGPSVSTPSVTVASVTTPVVPVTTPTVTVASVTTAPAAPAPAPAPTVTVPSITTPVVPVTTPTVTITVPPIPKF